MTQVFNEKRITPMRRILRKQQPKPEELLWNRVRNRKLKGYKFRRQFSIGRYIVDFYCPQARIVIELDGKSHFVGDAPEQDKVRQADIEVLGITFVRFTNAEVLENLDRVLGKISSLLP